MKAAPCAGGGGRPSPLHHLLRPGPARCPISAQPGPLDLASRLPLPPRLCPRQGPHSCLCLAIGCVYTLMGRF